LFVFDCIAQVTLEMAPDLNAVAAGGKIDYSKPGSSGYDIPKITYGDPKNRRVKVLTIGAGFSGILMAYQIQKLCEVGTTFDCYVRTVLTNA
jgi:hypothetical protein